jgi:hypothetical protein
MLILSTRENIKSKVRAVSFMKMEAVCCCETSVTIRLHGCHNPPDRNINLWKCCTDFMIWSIM